MFLTHFRSRILAAVVAVSTVALSVVALGSCEGDAAHLSGPKGATAFDRFIVIGTGLSMGAQSGGIYFESQVGSWPALIAKSAGVNFRQALLRAPGCQPPRIAPLQLSVYLSGASVTGIDSTCAGTIDTLTPPMNNLAISGATAYAALFLTPKLVLNAVAPYPAGDRARYPLVLGSTQSQVTAMRIEGASFVAVELGMAEVLGAATSGLLVPATSYTQTAPYTYVPSSVFEPVYTAIADSVKLTGAKVALIGVPDVTRIYGMRVAAELWNDRAELATFGVIVNANCGTSPNSVFTGSLIPSLYAQYAATGAPQNLSCADVPGTADAVLTPADLVTLSSAVTAMNTKIQAVAQQNGWAFVDLFDVYPNLAVRAAYTAAEQLACVYPYGALTSLDGVFPNAAGQQQIAYAVDAAINAKYGFTLPVAQPAGLGAAAAKLCP